MASVPIQIRRTSVANTPPTGLAEGQLAVGMADTPPSLWVGVPVALDPSGRKLIAPALKVTTQLFTSSGTYVPPPGLRYAIVECSGGGGGGGGVFAGVSAYAGGGGGTGSYSRGIVPAAQIGVSQPVTVGAGGSSGTSGAGSSFGTLVTANGGGPGQGNDLSAFFGGAGAGGAIGSLAAGVTGITLRGAPGHNGVAAQMPTGQWLVYPGNGGSFWGGGAWAGIVGSANSVAGSNGSMGGGGTGGGSNANNAQVGVNGGSGGNGWCLVTEYSL